jgi:hypothetical protein
LEMLAMRKRSLVATSTGRWRRVVVDGPESAG